ncbi:uncharacterized protein K452DRAFT_317987 [Aplosporella prunicola CBS 121167]|uniref:Xylanolytic transcriptional activator regulatory domain-containing protein n=1 Tax=Aplosporella prunicola CBS 121167 TaxID=1176127 RepID=A0A6A6BG94_9PEZI|nr:uncharacterized protein K452DRAFT_317987 [Aplosporella prunicola CBS 121167]KAF2142315.1 hypothetical protein K452DRAFT_317987 [Aplosporella prunicola CBS 121167]
MSAGHVPQEHQSRASSGDADLSIALDQSSQQLPETRLATQFAQSIDNIQGHSAQLFGASSEADPWLLRHCQFDEFGMQNFHKQHFRNAGGVPIAGLIPVHFSISPDELQESARAETGVSTQHDRGAELSQVVPSEYGPRLVALFCRRVFPLLPVISRSQLGITPESPSPGLDRLESVPVHLRAAIYASALPFATDDSHLSVWQAYSKPSLARLWRIVYELMLEEIHQPHLSVLQALLLYLHKSPTDEPSWALPDTPFLWSLVGSTVGLATSLGLQLECVMYGLPSWEKRLRKRLWWAVYAEDKWRSLLMGRPPYIHRDEWDVDELQSSDFAPFQDHAYIPFQWFVELTLIAASVQSDLYSLTACHALSGDLNASIEKARPLLDRLSTWRSSFPDPSSCPYAMHFAYLTLVVYVYRALLRPTVQSSRPPHIIDLEDPALDPTIPLGDFGWDFSDLRDVAPFPAVDVSDSTSRAAVADEVFLTAESCAARVISSVRGLSFADVDGFWPAWSRIGFAVTSNFVLLLLVQAPSAQHVAKTKQLLDLWERSLCSHGRLWPLVRLGLARLHAFTSRGLARSFFLVAHGGEVGRSA